MPAVWVDAQIAPALAQWMREALGIDAVAVRDLGLRHHMSFGEDEKGDIYFTTPFGSLFRFRSGVDAK